MRSLISRMVKRSAVVLGVGSLMVVTACSGQAATSASPTAGSTADGCVTDYAAGRDYFPDKSEVKYAKNFALTYHGSYQVVTVAQPAPGQPAEKYVFYRCGTPVPELTGDLAGAQAVSVPIKSLFSGSTTHLPLLDELGQLSVLKGVTDGTYITNPEVRRMIADKQVIQYATNQAADSEIVISSRPDVVLTEGTDDPAYPVIRQAGIAVVANSEWLEQDPLGRAEWIKFVGALTGQEAEATKVFDQIELDYQRVAEKAKEAGAPVSVLPGQMYQGNWWMPAGDLYVANLIKDANGTYGWSDVRQNSSLMLSLEDVLAKSKDADVWIMTEDVKTLDDVAKSDPRYAEFKAFQEGNVWSNNAKVTPEGGNDYWERGVTRPDLVLADMVKILHPDALPDREFEFYRQVAR